MDTRSEQRPSDMQARLLMDAAAKLAETFDKQIGMLLTLKKGLGHLYKLEIGQVVVLTQVFDRPLDNLSEGAGGSHYHRKSDIAIMHYDEENGAIEVAVDSRFFEPYTGEIA